MNLSKADKELGVTIDYETKYVVCPSCGEEIEYSDYLDSIFHSRPRVNYLANMVTHYRHQHTTYWDKCWGYKGYAYRSNWFGDYDDEKEKINENQKRKILREQKDFLISHGFKVSDFKALQNTSEETIELAQKILEGKKISKEKSNWSILANLTENDHFANSFDLEKIKPIIKDGIAIFGRTTWEALETKPDNCECVVISKTLRYGKFSKAYPGVKLYRSLSAFFKAYRKDKRKVWICGGLTLFKKAFPYCSKLKSFKVESLEESTLKLPKKFLKKGK